MSKTERRQLTEEEKIKIQNAKQELREYRENLKYINEKQDDIEELKAILEKTTTRLSKTKTSNNSMSADKFSDGIDRLHELEKDYDKKLQDILLKKFVIDDKIELVEQPYKNILFYRYARGKEWKDIADQLGYNTQYVFELHGEALYLYSKI